jgi:hypothetical protein
MEKIYLTQISQFIGKLTGNPQQIVKSNNPNIQYLEYQELVWSNNILTPYPKDKQLHMIIIVDADIDIKKISWSPDFGIALNSDDFNLNTNSDKVHCINWDTEEIEQDENGLYIDEEGARNGILNIQKNQKYINMSDDVFEEIKSFPIQ